MIGFWVEINLDSEFRNQDKVNQEYIVHRDHIRWLVLEENVWLWWSLWIASAVTLCYLSRHCNQKNVKSSMICVDYEERADQLFGEFSGLCHLSKWSDTPNNIGDSGAPHWPGTNHASKRWMQFTEEHYLYSYIKFHEFHNHTQESEL